MLMLQRCISIAICPQQIEPAPGMQHMMHTIIGVGASASELHEHQMCSDSSLACIATGMQAEVQVNIDQKLLMGMSDLH